MDSSVRHAVRVDGGEERTSVSMMMTVMQQEQEKIRCIDIDGVKFFEFWREPGRCVRYVADEFLMRLMELRADPQPGGDDWFPKRPPDQKPKGAETSPPVEPKP